MANEKQVVAVVDVNLVHMRCNEVVEHQNIIVRNGRIETIGGVDKVAVPKAALALEGNGKYLMPGLTDMHMHFLFGALAVDALLYVANGVTTVRNMAGFEIPAWLPILPVHNHLQAREKLWRDELIGPTMYTTGPAFEDWKSPYYKWPVMQAVGGATEASKAVAALKQAGYDFVKVYNNVSREAYYGILKEAGKQSMKVVGHAPVPSTVKFEEVLRERQMFSIEHLSGYINPFRGFSIPADKMDDYAALTREAGVWNCPTIVAWENNLPPAELGKVLNREEMKYVPVNEKRWWRKNQRIYDALIKKNKNYVYPGKHRENFIRMLRALHKAGARLLLGTDGGTNWAIPGFSAHDELGNLVEAGLSPFEALQSGTVYAAEALGKLAEMGTVEVGKRADLLLVDGNPLKDVANVRKRSGVMLRGRWFANTELQSMLDGLVCA